MTAKKTRWIIGGTTALLVLLVALRVVSNIRASHHRADGDPLPVDVDTARVQSMPVLVQAVGQVQSEHSVQVRPQVNGLLQQVSFSEGQTVAEGQSLFRIDPAPFQAALASAKAAAENAKANADRLEPLAKQEFVTPQEYENARATSDQAAAAYQQAQINLSYTDIKAPIGGRTGSLAVKSGNLVAPTDATPLVVINQMKPILVQYAIPQQVLEQVRSYQAKHPIDVVITHEDGQGQLDQGQLVFVDNTVNTSTGTVMLKARLPNSREQLWPGQYVGVRMQLALQANAVVIPVSAVQTGQDGNFVYLVVGGKAVTRPVKVDRQVDNLAIIASGLKGGEHVVTLVPRNLRPDLAVAPLVHDVAPAAAVNLPVNP